MFNRATLLCTLLAGFTMVLAIRTATANSPSYYKAAIGRSPFLLLGETLIKPLPPRLLGKQIASQKSLPPPAFGKIVPWNQARRYSNQTITIEGKVVLAHQPRNGQVCFLNFTHQWRGRFYVILFKKVLGHWKTSPKDFFLNKTIRVTGKVQYHNHTPQIRVTDPEQIQIIDPDKASHQD